jgi:hypothetical protein
MVQFRKQALYHVFQGLGAQHVAAAGTTFRVTGGRRRKWADTGLAVAHKMWVCSMVLSKGKGSCGLEKVVKPEDGNYNIYQNVGITPTSVAKP